MEKKYTFSTRILFYTILSHLLSYFFLEGERKRERTIKLLYKMWHIVNQNLFFFTKKATRQRATTNLINFKKFESTIFQLYNYFTFVLENNLTLSTF